MNNLKKLDKNNVEDILALTAIQEGMLFHYLNEPESREYFEQLTLSLTGRVDTHILKEAWQFVAETNDMLRTVFRWDMLEKPVQVVLKTKSVPVKEYDFSRTGEEEKLNLFSEIKSDDRRKGIDICENPFRVTLCKLEDTRYEMVISSHHIVYDGWSTGIILKEFFEAYSALCHGREPYRSVKTKYKEFIKWYLKQDMDRQEEYWKSYLNGFGTRTVLSVKTGKRSNEAGRLTANIDMDLMQNIGNFLKEQQVTLAALLYCAWGILLQIYTNSDDIVFGTTVAGRNIKIKGIENIVGLFINTLPLRVKADTDKEILQAVRDIYSSMQAREEYEHTSLVKIKSCSQVDSEGDLFDSVVVIDNYPISSIFTDMKDDLYIDSYVMSEMTNFDLTLDVTTAGGILFHFNYNMGCFKKETIENLSRHFINILKGIVENPRQKLSEINMLSEEEREEILFAFNNTKAEYAQDKTLHELFEERAEKSPDNIAVRFKNQKLTYKEMNEKSNRLARGLRGKGVAPNGLVGVLMERSLEMVIGLMAVLKAGGAYLPIDPGCPHERLAYILKDSGAKILLTQKKLAEILRLDGEIINIEDWSLYSDDGTNLEKVNTSRDLAYVIYTSGSTGKPKGSLIEHYSVVNRLNWMQKKYPIGEEDVILQKTPYTFDVSVWELFWWSIQGAGVCMLVPGGEKDPGAIVDAVEKYKVTVMHFVPSMLGIFLEYIEDEMQLDRLASLKHVFASGEALGLAHVQKFNNTLNKHNETLLHNLYGPTEATIDVSYFDCSDGKELERIPIGKPIDNIRLYIMDRHQNLQPLGVPGELCISGDGVGRGYLNRPELTAEKFVADPFFPGRKMYRTGDLAKWLDDGNIEYLGRMDHQVKIRGFRVELGEIEAQLSGSRLVSEVAVIDREDIDGKYLCLYFVPDKNSLPVQLREYLSGRLPDYMIPSRFVPVEKIPLTPNGKIDRKILGTLDANAYDNEQYIEPSNDIEEKMTVIWQEVLGGEKIGVNDNFFRVGGNSLKAITLASKIHKTLNIDIPLKEIFSRKTIREIAKYIENAEKNIYLSIQPAGEKEHYTVSPAQRRLYILSQLENIHTSYNMPGAMLMRGNVDKARVEEVFKLLIKRHEVLRTSFEFAGGTPVQYIHSDVNFRIEYMELPEDLDMRAEGDLGSTVAKMLKDFIRPFDLSRTPLLRAGLARLAEAEYVLMYDIHHIISDGVSIEILMNEFACLYEGKSLNILRLQYKDYAEWQNNNISNRAIRKQEEYWLGKFSGKIPVLNMPTDFPRPGVRSFEGDHVRFEIGRDLADGLYSLAGETDSTLYMVLLAVYNVLLSKYTGQEDILVGLSISGRNHADLEGIIGMFVNTLVMRNYPEGEKTFKRFLEEVRENSLEAFQNQDYQFEELVEKLELERDNSRNLLFDTMFVLQNASILPMELGGTKFIPYEFDNKIAKFDINVNAVETKEGITVILEYCTKLFTGETIAKMAERFVNIVREVVRNPEVRLRDIELMNEEKKYMMLSFNENLEDG